MEMDRILLSMVQKATGLAIPMVDQGIGVEHCPRPPVTRVAEKSYQNWMMRTPVRLGGMGLRSVAETSLAELSRLSHTLLGKVGYAHS